MKSGFIVFHVKILKVQTQFGDKVLKSRVNLPEIIAQPFPKLDLDHEKLTHATRLHKAGLLTIDLFNVIS